jgi:predicted dehydrogenase
MQSIIGFFYADFEESGRGCISVFKVGIIGVGFIGEKHLLAFNTLASVHVSAIAELDRNRRELCYERYAPDNVFSHHHELLALTDLDLVVVCVPNHLHAKVTNDALNAGHNVLCEKPMATSVADATAMLKTANANQRSLMIAMNFRWEYFGAGIFHLKRLIDEGRLGKVYFIRAHYLRRQTFPMTNYERWNLSQEHSGGGVLIDLGSHMLDLAMWLLDDYQPQSVNGMTYNALSKYAEVDDFASGSVTMSNDARVQIDLAWNSHCRSSWQIDVYGEQGGAVVSAGGHPDDRRLTLFSSQDTVPVSEEVSVADFSLPMESSLQAHVVNCLKAGEASQCSAERALQVTRVIEAWYRSSESGRDVLILDV